MLSRKLTAAAVLLYTLLGCATVRTGVGPTSIAPPRRIHLLGTCDSTAAGPTGRCDRAVADALRAGLTSRGIEVSDGAEAMPENIDLRIDCECNIGDTGYLSYLFVVVLEAHSDVIVATGAYIPGWLWQRRPSNVEEPIDTILDGLYPA
jgi:hypothetical protein